jgi:o-succinylbenzoate synthase
LLLLLDMDLRHVRVILYRLPFREPYVTAEGAVTHRQGFIVQIEAEDGLIGLGEASFLPHEAGGQAALARSLRDLAGRAAGADMAEFGGGVAVKREPGWPAFAFAMTDLIARARGDSVAALFPHPVLGAVPVNALIGGVPLEQATVAARAALAAGFGTVKLKVGVEATLDAEVARVAAVREALGAHARLRLDANGAWNEEQAPELLKGFAKHDIEYIEQPVPPGHLDVLKRLRGTGLVPIAADEDVSDTASAERVLETGAADVLVLKPLQFAGLGPARAIAERAAALGVGTTITTSIDSGVGTAIALQLAAALETKVAHGLATPSLLEDDLIAAPGLPLEAGAMRLSAAPGLGVELDEAAIDKYAVAQWTFP